MMSKTECDPKSAATEIFDRFRRGWELIKERELSSNEARRAFGRISACLALRNTENLPNELKAELLRAACTEKGIPFDPIHQHFLNDLNNAEQEVDPPNIDPSDLLPR